MIQFPVLFPDFCYVYKQDKISLNISRTDNDIELFKRIAADDHYAFTLLLERHRANLYGQAMAYLKDIGKAQDVIQEVFMAIWKNRKNLEQVSQPENYLFIMARNKIVGEFRKKILQPLPEMLGASYIDSNILPADLLEHKQLLNLVRSEVEKMPPQRKKVFELCKFEGLKHEEIAQLMGISKNTVKVHMVQALSFIRSAIRKYHNTVLPVLIFFKNLF